MLQTCREELEEEVHRGLRVVVVVPVFVAVGIAAVRLTGGVVAARIVHEVRRIGRHQYGFLVAKEGPHGAHVGRIAAKQPVVAQLPDIARLRDGVGLCGIEGGVRIEVLDAFALVAGVERLEELGHLVIVETRQGEVDFWSGVQLGQEASEQLLVPGARYAV